MNGLKELNIKNKQELLSPNKNSTVIIVQDKEKLAGRHRTVDILHFAEPKNKVLL